MIEDRDLDAWVVRGGDEGIARTEAGADNAELGVAALLQPVEAGADISDALTDRVDGSTDVGGDGVVGAGKAVRTADVVVRHAHAQGGDAEHVKDLAEAVVADAVGVPLRQNDYRAVTLRREPARIHQVVLGIRRLDGRGEAEELSVGFFELLLGRFAASVEELDAAVLDAKIRRYLVGV